MTPALILLAFIVWVGLVLIECLSATASDQAPPDDLPAPPPADADEDANALPFGPTPGRFADPVKSFRTDQN